MPLFTRIRDYLWKHPDVPEVRSKPCPEVLFIPTQYRLIECYRQSALTAEQIAERLSVALWGIQEGLGGRKVMNTR